MAEQHTSAWCPHCKARVLAVAPDDRFHVGQGVLTFFTCGLWLPIWVLTGLGRLLTKRYRCTRCGTLVK